MAHLATLAAALTIVVAQPAWALNYLLQQDLGVRGQNHLCRYSNGKVYSYNATELCPFQVNDDGPPATDASPPSQTGFKSGEYLDGKTKVCVYSDNVLGRTEALRIGSVELCPQTQPEQSSQQSSSPQPRQNTSGLQPVENGRAASDIGKIAKDGNSLASGKVKAVQRSMPPKSVSAGPNQDPPSDSATDVAADEDSGSCVSFGLKLKSREYAACRIKLQEIRAIREATAQSAADTARMQQLESDRQRRNIEAEQQLKADRAQQAEDARAAQADASRKRQALFQVCFNTMLSRPTRTGSLAESIANADKCQANPTAHLQPDPPSWHCSRDGFGNVDCNAQ